MIVGHIGAALGVSSALDSGVAIRSGRLLLPALFGAAVFPDVVDIAYAKASFCSPMGLYSHGLLPLAIQSAAAFLCGYAVFRHSSAALALAVAVLLHLPSDLITGEKLLWNAGPIAGLSLYRWAVADFVVEGLVILSGWSLLRRNESALRAHPWATSWACLFLLIATQALVNSGSLSKPNACEASLVQPNQK